MDTPLECYGVSQREGRAMCADCHFKTGCAEFMGRRFGRIRLSDVRYELKTARLKHPEKVVTAYSDVETSYATAHRLVFGTTAKSMKLSPADAAGIEKVADDNHCSALELCLMLMKLWAKTQPELRFRPRNLLTAYSAKVLREARSAAVDSYGGFCSRSVADLTGVDVTVLKQKLRTSEIDFATYYVGSICKKPMSVENILRKMEYSLDPTWLALEDAYADILEASAQETLSRSASDHRHSVVRARKELLKDAHLRQAAYRTRSEIMPEAVAHVLNSYGLSPTELEVAGDLVTDSVKLWKQLATVIKHLNAHTIYGSIRL